MKRNHYYISIILVGMLNGCGQSTSPIPIGFGSITGNVELFDTTNNPLKNFSDVRIATESSSRFVISDSLGNFTLDSLPDGAITLVLSKPGFAEVHYASRVNDY